MDKKIIEKIVEIVEPILAAKNFDLVDIENKPSQEGNVLTIYIDKDGGVTLKDCEDVSIVLSAVLDTYDFINEHYILEVSSPGIYRELKKEKDFKRYLGYRVKVKLYEPIEIRGFGKQKVFMGKLDDYANNILKVVLDNNEVVNVEMKSVAKVNLEPDITSLLKNNYGEKNYGGNKKWDIASIRTDRKIT